MFTAAFGGKATSSDVVIKNNIVHIYAAVSDGSIYGGYAENGDLSGLNITERGGNTVYLHTGGSAGSTIYGEWAGHSFGGMDRADSNQVFISGGTATDVHGGFSNYGNATGNTVNISGSPALSGTIYGGGAFTGNTLNKDSGVNIASAFNSEFINFGYDGAANITTLNASPHRRPGPKSRPDRYPGSQRHLSQPH